MLTSQDTIATTVDDFYKELFGSAPEREFTLNMEELSLPARNLAHLEAPFCYEEVEKIIKGMPTDKAPGPDGFTGRFYASCCIS